MEFHIVDVCLFFIVVGHFCLLDGHWGIVTHFPKNPTKRIPKYVPTNRPQQWSVFVCSSNYCEWIDWHSELKTSFARLERPSTHQCTIQKIMFWDFMDGMKLSPRGQFLSSVIFILFFSCAFSWVLLFSFFFQLTFFSFGPSWRVIFFLPHLTPSFFFFFDSYLPPLDYLQDQAATEPT